MSGSVSGSFKYITIKRRQKKGNRNRQAIPVDPDSDFINLLPDDIIASILSRFTLKEAVQTSVVSRRWKNLWRYRFDGGSIVLSVEGYHACTFATIFAQEEFGEWVDNLLKLYENQPIHEFVLRYFFDKRLSSAVLRWLEFAIRNNVEKLYLDPGYPPHNFRYSNKAFEFPDLRQFVASSPLFSSVMDVSLGQFCINQDVFDNLLSRLPNLQRLSLRNIFGIKNVNIAGETMKCLEVKNCYNLEQVAISAPNLVLLKYVGSERKLHLGNLPLLSEFFISETLPHIFKLPQFPNIAAQLTTLKFVARARYLFSEKMCCSGICTYPQVSIAFPVLKRLEIVMDFLRRHTMLWPVSLIKNAPELNKFKIEMTLNPHGVFDCSRHRPDARYSQDESEADEWIWDGKMVKSGEHNSLKMVELHGFVNCANQWELLKQIVEIAENLEETVLEIDSSCDFLDSARVKRLAKRLVALPTKLVMQYPIENTSFNWHWDPLLEFKRLQEKEDDDD